MPRKRKSRIYWKRGRAYGDFRDLGGKREALVPEGDTRATTDPDIATKLASDRVAELEAEREVRERETKDRALGIRRPRSESLAAFAAHHLRRKAEDGEATRQWLTQAERHLREAVRFFGGSIDLGALSPRGMSRYVNHLRSLENGRGGNLSDTSVRKYLNFLSNLFRRAVAEGYVPSNPVGDMYAKPTEAKVEAEYLAPEEAALLLEAARTCLAPVDKVRQEHGGAISAHPNPHLHPILASFLLTGGRKSEALGLEVDDVSFRLGKVYFRSNRWRRLKTKRSKRTVPLWPQLRDTLEAYVLEREREGGLGSLLFASVGGRPRGDTKDQPERMIRDLRRALGRIGKRAGFPEGHVRLHMLRHTYTAARIQTLDRGAPVSLYTVARELGHASTDMIEDRYGHLHDRAVLGGTEEVAFRIEHHEETLKARIRALSEAPTG